MISKDSQVQKINETKEKQDENNQSRLSMPGLNKEIKEKPEDDGIVSSNIKIKEKLKKEDEEKDLKVLENKKEENEEEPEGIISTKKKTEKEIKIEKENNIIIKNLPLNTSKIPVNPPDNAEELVEKGRILLTDHNVLNQSASFKDKEGETFHLLP